MPRIVGPIIRTTAALLTLCSALVRAHSWVEQLMVIGPDGTFVGQPGYPRGNVLRDTPGFSDSAMTYLIPPNDQGSNAILPSTPICAPTQRTPNQTDGSPRLRAPVGAAIALRYQENGHVTLPDNPPGKPPNRGTVYIYGTTQPRENDTLLAIHKVWNRAGTGGDGRGVLLSARGFDDGRCYQINNGPISTTRQVLFPHEPDELMGADLWCQQDIVLPENLPTGEPYTLYWVWDWPTLGFNKRQEEIYTTCIDIDIIEGHVSHARFNVREDIVAQKDLNNAAIPSQLAELLRDQEGDEVRGHRTVTGPGFTPLLPPYPFPNATAQSTPTTLLTQTSSTAACGTGTPYKIGVPMDDSDSGNGN